MAFDAHKNFATSLVATAPSPATSGTSLVVTGGEGTRFPAVSFNATIGPANAEHTPANSEIVRVTAISTDTFTITRAQESTSARTVVVGDRIAATITKKTLEDIEAGTNFPALGVAGVVNFDGNARAVAYASGTAGGSGQSIAHATWAGVTFDTEEVDIGTMHSTSADTHKFTIPTGMGGFYLIDAKIGWPANTTGDRLAAITKNAIGSGFLVINPTLGSAIASGTGTGAQTVSWAGELAAGDWIALNAYQSSGGALIIGGDGGSYYTCRLSIVRLF